MAYTIKKQLRNGLPQIGVAPYRQIHPHSTGNPNSTAQNEADYMSRKDVNSGFYTHVVGNGQVIQTARVGAGCWDVGGGYNYETYAAVEIIESHKTQAEFDIDYAIYIELLRDLATEASIPKTLDTTDLAGIKTHDHCRRYQPNNGTDHVDPYPYLAKWGISKEQFKKDIENGVPTTKNGWEKVNNEWYYYDNGVLVKNGWRNSNGKWYLFDAHSKMLTGWQTKGGKWYYFLADGAMHVGWSLIDGKWYYFNQEGIMTEGWKKIGDKWYYMEKSGAMRQGWFKDKSNKWYYLSVPDGEMVTGTKSIDGKKYIFDNNGVCTNP